MSQERLKYHQPTLDLLGEKPIFSDTHIHLLTQLERETGISLPASIKEWYSLENGVEILANYSNTDHATEVSDLGRYNKYWRDAKYHHFNFLLEQNLLIILIENQGVWTWVVKLDGSDDPQVLITSGLPEPENVWEHCVDRFSTFVYTRVWDFKDWGGDFYLWAYNNEKLERKDLEFLMTHFSEGPQTYSYGCIMRRFYKDTKCIHLWVGEDETEWNVWAATSEELAELVSMIWGCANLAQTLEAIDEDNSASYVLQDFRNQQEN